ncbi:PA3496 family putative envelope integrity protein [Alkalilimnicola sp. S0819]|uniref:PA3496 family putative envelope integrity protein n=1 Tax=Alkalilimnicola sp. S0819 TaxID=2613922 RepID=UPI00186A53C5|nr:hypothetical protein [Alkalilimnicola sp. S0819]
MGDDYDADTWDGEDEGVGEDILPPPRHNAGARPDSRRAIEAMQEERRLRQLLEDEYSF